MLVFVNLGQVFESDGFLGHGGEFEDEVDDFIFIDRRAQSIEGICWVYATYHATSTLTSWVRCVQRQPDGQSYVRAAALRTGVMAGIAAFSMAMTIALGQHLF